MDWVKAPYSAVIFWRVRGVHLALFGFVPVDQQQILHRSTPVARLDRRHPVERAHAPNDIVQDKLFYAAACAAIIGLTQPLTTPMPRRVSRPDGRSGKCRKAAGEESPGSIDIRCRITSGGGDPRESATENEPPAFACGSCERQVRVKRCGKSAPRVRQRSRHGKPHREQNRIGTATRAVRESDNAAGRCQARRPGRLLEAMCKHCPRGMAVTYRLAQAGGALQNPAYRPADISATRGSVRTLGPLASFGRPIIPERAQHEPESIERSSADDDPGSRFASPGMTRHYATIFSSTPSTPPAR